MYASEVKELLAIRTRVAELRREADRATKLADAIDAEIAVYHSHVITAEEQLAAHGSTVIPQTFLGQKEMENAYVAHFTSLGYNTTHMQNALAFSIGPY